MVDNRLADPEQMAVWKAHPLTKEFHRFLRERRESWMDLWSRGQAMSERQQSEAVTLGWLENLRSEEIEAFYGNDDEHQRPDPAR